MCRSRLKRENVQEVKTKETIIESSSDEEYAYTIKKKTEHVSVVSSISAQPKPHLRWSEVELPEVTLLEAALTGNDVTGSDVRTGSDRVRVVVQNVLLRMTDIATGCDVIKRHVTPKGFPWKGGMRACATGNCAIFALVGPFHRK